MTTMIAEHEVRAASGPAAAGGFTRMLTLAAAPERVFRELADIENLPRWAGAFCERVELARGRWVALTSLGELFLALDADEPTGAITLWAGWRAGELYALPLRVAAADEAAAAEAEGIGAAGTRVTLIVPCVGGDDHVRLCRALCEAWPGLAAR